MQQRFNVRKVAVLGAGVMGAQIAAHLVNADVPVVLFELPAKEGDPNGIVAQGDREPARSSSRRRSASPRTRALIEPANYERAPRPAHATATS